MIWAIIVVLIIALDQLTKYIVINNINFGDSIPVIDKFFYLAHWQNKGAAWGILQNGRAIFIPVTIVVSIVMIYYLYKMNDRILRASLSMILGGAMGNFIDRLFREGGVVDFLDFHFGSYNFPTFNVADSFVVIGTIVLSYYILFVKKEEEIKS